MTLAVAAERVGVTPATLRRWGRDGLIPEHDGSWTPAAVGQARIVARLRERGHSVAEIRRATAEGRLAFGFLEELFPADRRRHSITEAARETAIDEGLAARLVSGLGITPDPGATVSAEDLELLRYAALALESGFPLVALLQLVRVYGQAMARIAVHAGVALYRDGDYYGRDINIAARVAARAAGGEVLVTRPVVELSGARLSFAPTGELALKGLRQAVEVFTAGRGKAA